MALHSLGKVTTNAGTLVRLTNNQTDPTARVSAHSFMVEALLTNTQKVYIGGSGLNKTTLADVYAVLAIPTNNTLPTFSATVTFAPSAFNLNEIYIDVDTNGEGALVSFVRA